MSYPLRLPDALNGAARERAEYMGISLNALVCVALDAYLRGPSASPPASFQPKVTPLRPKPLDPEQVRQQRADALGIPEGMRDVYDLDLYDECLGPDAQPETPEDIAALVGEFEATLHRRQQAVKAKGKTRKKAS